MSYEIRAREPADTAVRRIAREEISAAIADLDDDRLDPHTTTHEVRKRCKKLRALLRLIRPHLGETFAAENILFRDASRTLSDLRDATALIETYDALMARFADEIDRRTFGPIRRQLTLRRRHIADGQLDLAQRLATFRETMIAARERVDGWTVDAEEFDALAGGLSQTYGRGRRAMAQAYADPSPEHFHEWRKRVKYHWYHVTILQPLWPDLLKARYEALDCLSHLLGEDHDLAVLRHTLLDAPDRFGNRHTLSLFLDLLGRRQAELRTQAHPLGLRLFAEKPRALSRRFDGLWHAWRLDTTPASAAAPVGEPVAVEG